ncbi:hypothetical protein [Aquimarina spongiae]|uniref:hypothetical protein n=1 Tax=Aquimarina spongiae TaxID=570521 RepID=UPI00111501AE|nr:hypothetical protein [Aquimarina spongiae]
MRPINRTHNPKVAGSNLAPATKKISCENNWFYLYKHTPKVQRLKGVNPAPATKKKASEVSEAFFIVETFNQSWQDEKFLLNAST